VEQGVEGAHAASPWFRVVQASECWSVATILRPVVPPVERPFGFC
jgi:hypothetical protein